MSHNPTASQTVGPFFSIGLAPLYHSEMAWAEANVVRVEVDGRVLDGDGQPIPDAVLEFWCAGAQNSGDGEFPYGFARTATDDRGRFQVVVVKPEPRSDPGGEVHAPHLVVLIFMRGLLRHLMTRVYFAGEVANERDVVLCTIPSERRNTLFAHAVSDETAIFQWEIRLQGDRETVFFDA